MTEDFAKEGLKTLYAHYKNQQFDRQELANIKAGLLKEPEEAMVKAVSLVTDNYKTLPTARQFLGIVRGISRAEKPEESVNYQPTEYGKRSLQLLKAIIRLEPGAPYPDILIEGATVMGNAYPQYRSEWRDMRQQMLAFNQKINGG